MDPMFFATPDAFRDWLEEHHDTETELSVGFWKRGSGRPSISWPEAVDQALCFGWIDGVRRSLGADAYTIRFTPRRPRSIWSTVNTRRFAALDVQGQVAAAATTRATRSASPRAGGAARGARSTWPASRSSRRRG